MNRQGPTAGDRRMSRRSLLKVGGVGLLGSHLAGLCGASGGWLRRLSAAEEQAGPPARAKAVIFLHQWGGPSHHDTIDLKPDAPAEIRGEFGAIDSSLPGLRVCEHLPRFSQVMDKFCLVRGIHHTMNNHNSAGYYSLTGHAPPTDDQRLRDTAELFPSYGSIVDRLAPAESGMPTFVAFPHVIRDGSVTPGQQTGFLGKQHAPLLVTEDPNEANFDLPSLSLPANLSLERLEHRRALQELVDRQTSLLEFSSTARGVDAAFQKALTMLASPKVKQAFDLSAEPAELRDAYGRTTYGQSCLLARRLVEAGARFVNVYFANRIGGASGGWDTHDTNFPLLKNHLLPKTDQAVPTLLNDLAQRGLLDETLVVWMGEFGRTPKINGNAGRDHWPHCYPALLAGGGVKQGFTHGASDKIGAYPDQFPVRPDDVAATIFYLLGIDPQREVYDQLGRPLTISAGAPIMDLIA